MKNITKYLYENITEGCTKYNQCYEGHEEDEKTIVDEKSFREWAKAKFEKVFGDDLDKERMKNTIDGLLKDNKDLVDRGEWGELVGKMNKSFG